MGFFLLLLLFQNPQAAKLVEVKVVDKDYLEFFFCLPEDSACSFQKLRQIFSLVIGRDNDRQVQNIRILAARALSE